MISRIPLILLALTMTVAAGCSARSPNDGKQTVELLVFAAASLTDGMMKAGELYENRHPNVKIMFNLAASGTLQRQIEQGAPADVFISAGEHQMEALVGGQFIHEEDVKRFLGNQLVLIVPTTDPQQINDIHTLLLDDYKRIAIGQPETVPAGKYAMQTLSSAGVWNEIESKLVYGKDVRSVLSYVETGNADAGIVYRTDALTSDKVTIALTVNTHDPVTYPAAALGFSKHREEAKHFVQFLQEDDGLQIFIDLGFVNLR